MAQKSNNNHNHPKIALWHHHLGIGDLVWHIPYMRALAAHSKDQKITLITRPSTMPHDLLAHEECVGDILIFDRKPRKSEGRKGLHDGYNGRKKFIKELRSLDIDMLYIFSNRLLYGKLAKKAGIKNRAGYGFRPLSRVFLSMPPYIQKDNIEGSRVYHDATKFMLAHGIINEPIVPKMNVSQAIIDEMHQCYHHLPKPWFGFSIGGSEPKKCWSSQNFAKLADMITQKFGGSIFLLGGPKEHEIARQIIHHAQHQQHIQIVTDKTIGQTAGLLRSCIFSIGNDTGALNLSVANNTPALGLFGATLPLKHDPILYGLQANSMTEITVESVFDALTQHLDNRME